jgi:hypothetical protein
MQFPQDLLILGLICLVVSALAYLVSRSGRELVYIVPVSVEYEVFTAILGLLIGLSFTFVSLAAALAASLGLGHGASLTAALFAGVIAMAGPCLLAPRWWRHDVALVKQRRESRRRHRRSRRV